MKFCAAINCTDGRVQEPVSVYLRRRFGATYVDTITEPGPNRILAESAPDERVAAILERVAVSVEKHGSAGIAVVGHHDCAGNPADKAEQLVHTRHAVEFLKGRYPDIDIIGLWVNEAWQVEELV